MKNQIFIILLMFFVAFCGCNNKKNELQVVTFNVRYDNPNDGINRWEFRVPLIESYFAKERPDIIGMQEVKYDQIIDFQKILPGYDYVFVNDHFKVKSYRVDRITEGKVFISDHWPVVSFLEL